MAQLSSDTLSLIQSAAQRLREVVGTLPDDPSLFIEETGIQDRVTLRLILAIQDCISIAAEVVAQSGRPTGGGLAHLFEGLAEREYIPWEMVPGLQESVRLRNKILFDFESVNVNELYDAASQIPEILVEFLTSISGSEDK